MKTVQARCDDCAEINTVEVEDKARKGEPTNTYCPICDDHTEHTITDID